VTQMLLFGQPETTIQCGANAPMVEEEEGWAVWTPRYQEWWPFPPDLAAKYAAQGCAVRLMNDGEAIENWAPPSGNPKESRPTKPPFLETEIVWHYRQAECFPDRHNRLMWERIAAWIRSHCRHPRPEDVAENLSRKLGWWAGKFDAEKDRLEHGPHWEP
jgi:hypothetical protein